MTTIREHDEELLEQETTTCCHHWVIDSPNGPVSRGVCKRCGTTREFYNSVPGYAGVWARSTGTQRKANDKTFKPVDGEDGEPVGELVDTETEADHGTASPGED